MSRGCCLIFHRAIAHDQWAAMPNRGFHLDLAYLERLIGFVRARGWDIVTLDEAMARRDDPGARRFVNFSLDDGYRDTAEAVAPLFRRLAAPLTVFVATGIPDGTMRMQNAGLETILRTTERVEDGGRRYALATPRDRRAAYAAISARWEAAGGDDAYVGFCARHGQNADALDAAHRITWAQLETLRDGGGIEIGAHTVSHRRISSLDAAAAASEIAGSRARLQARLGVPALHFAFPYGQAADCGQRDFDLARRAGFSTASTTVKGLVGAETDPFALPRNTINGVHRHVIFAHAHLSGLSGRIDAFRGRGRG